MALEQSVSLDLTGMQALSSAPADVHASDQPYPLWTRMLTIAGGSALLWAVIGLCAGLAARPALLGALKV